MGSRTIAQLLHFIAAVAVVTCIGACSASSGVDPIITHFMSLPIRGYAPTEITGGSSNLVFAHKEPAVYPEEIKEAGIAGTVIVQALVRTGGRVLEARVLDGVHPQLDTEAIRATLSCVFDYDEKLGGPMSSAVFVAYQFTLY